MEGGTENDVKILELEDEEEKAEKSEPGKKEEGRLMDSDKKVVEKEDASKKAETSQPAEEEKKDKEDGKLKESPGQEEEEKGEEGEDKDDADQSQVVKESPVSVKDSGDSRAGRVLTQPISQTPVATFWHCITAPGEHCSRIDLISALTGSIDPASARCGAP
ncbi:hypothetical protein chiPu_0026633 [Chiloscyllium punctatum]|uniref:Uncharacterized protein n=1 Tax=Chiloscyllium punctatum TaxID=137246 RepID=A0A401TJ55_CHIPU|nr:hypothetical protein [Chiloscyllium punctatum]